MTDPVKTFPQGLWSLVQVWRKRRAPVSVAPEDEFPGLDVDFEPMKRRTILSADEINAASGSGLARRASEMVNEFVGSPYLVFLNALIIMLLRKREWPEHAPELFNRLWEEEAEFLLENLDTRWMISSIITFADHGQSRADRRVGQSLNVLFSLMKLYETERLFSGHTGSEPFTEKPRWDAGLPMGMPHFSLLNGDLEANLLAPMLEEAREAHIAGPLALHLMQRLKDDEGNLFHRLEIMRQTRHENRKNP